MKATDFKYYLGIILLFIVDASHNLFFENNSKFDVYLYYDHQRYLTNILYDISNLFKFSLLTFWLRKLNRNVFTPLFYSSLLIWVLYFLFYNQKESIIIIPFYILLTYIYNKSNFIK